MIKEADKGGAVVIMNTKYYLKMISDHLNDKTIYKMVESNCDVKVMKGIARIIEKYEDNLTKRELTQVILMASLKFANLNLFKTRSKNNKKSIYILFKHQI